MNQPNRNISQPAATISLILILSALLSVSGCISEPVSSGYSINGSIYGDYISGTVYVAALSADNTTTGDIRVMETFSHPEESVYVTACDKLEKPGNYSVSNLPEGEYYIYAWADTDENNLIDHADYRDPTGWYRTGEQLSPAKVSVKNSTDTEDISIRLISPTPYPAEDIGIKRGSGGGKLTTIRGYKVLQLSGTPDERAYSMGYLCGPQVRDWVDYVLIETFMDSPDNYENLFIPLIKEHMVPANADYMHRLDAMVEGMKDGKTDLMLNSLGRDLNSYDILAENAYPFLLYFRIYGIMGGDLDLNITSSSDNDPPVKLCSSAVAWGNRTDNAELKGGVIHGKNMDGENDLRKVTVNSLLIIATDPTDDPALRRTVGFDWPGYAGTFNAMNEKGLVIVPHSSPSIPDWNATDLIPYSFLYMDTLQREDDLEGAWNYWNETAGTKTGGNNAGVSAPYMNGSGSIPGAFEVDSYGGVVRVAEFMPPSDPCSLIITNNFFTYRGANRAAVEKVNGYHPEIEESNYRYLDMLSLFETYEEENRKIGTPEMIRIMQAASTSEQYKGVTEYSYIAYPDSLEFSVATEDLENHILDAPFAGYTKFGFDEVFR